MAKKPKKTKYSKGWETRRANAKKLGVSPHQFKAKRGSHLKPPLRNDLIEREMRRAARKPVIADALASTAEAQAINAVRDDWENVRQGMNKALFGDNAPGHGEIVGGADAKLAEALVKLARSKGGKDQMQNEIARIRSLARYEGETAQDKSHTQRLIDVQQKMADAVVCGVIAEIEAAQRMYSGLPKNMVWSLSSFTMLRIVDALNDAGYTSKGRREPGTLGQRHGSTG